MTERTETMTDGFFDIGLFHYIILAIILFIIGMTGVIVSRSMFRIVMSMFVICISVVINFLAFGCYCSDSLKYANIMSFLIIVMTLLQATDAFALFLKVDHSNEYLDIEKIKDKEQ